MNRDATLFTLARNIVRHRTNANLSQDLLAERADLSRPFVSRIECAKGNASIVTVARIAKALRVKPAELLEGM